MNKDRLINIKGHLYDAQSGLPIKPSGSTGKSKHNQGTGSNSKERAFSVPSRKAPKRFMDIARSSAISRFVPSHASTKSLASEEHDSKPQKHPLETKVRAAQKAKPLPTPKNTPKQFKPAQVIKQEAIAEAMAKPSIKPTKKRFWTKRSRFISLATSCLVFILLGGYLAYLYLPSLSVQVAAARAGIKATYPEYRPDGYKLKGPVAYKDTTVIVEFVATAGKTGFKIIQTKSSWDSTAVRENLVKEKADNDYITTQERGLTIYVYNSNAAWVNGGILYTIEGNAPLSSEQIRRIAASL